MTTNEEKIYRHDKRQLGLEMQKRLSTLGNKLQDYPRIWSKAALALAEYWRPDVVICAESNDFESIEVRVKRSVRDRYEHLSGHIAPMQTVATIAESYFNFATFNELIMQIQETKRELAEIEQFCAEIGDPLP
jgi:hypothetical protein